MSRTASRPSPRGLLGALIQATKVQSSRGKSTLRRDFGHHTRWYFAQYTKQFMGQKLTAPSLPHVGYSRCSVTMASMWRNKAGVLTWEPLLA